MTDDEIRLTRRKVLGGLGAIGVTSAGAGLGTTAYFSDDELFENNTLTAGELDLLVDWQQTYTGPDGREYINAHPDHDGDGRQSIHHPEEEYAVEYTGRNLVELLTCETAGFDDDYDVTSAARPDQEHLIELSDLKPGDTGEITFSLHLCDNPGYIWMQGREVANEENGYTEPEPSTADAGDVNDPGDTDGRGELADSIDVELWHDRDCDNSRDEGEPADIVLTLDGSGSMFYDRYGGVVSDDPITVDGTERAETTKIDLVERGVRQLLDALAGSDPDIEIGALFFDGFDPDDGTLDNPQTELFGLTTPSDLANQLGSFREVVASLTGGTTDPDDGGSITTGTALEPGIEQAQAELRDSGRAVRSVNVVFTDGEPYRGGSLEDSYFDGVRDSADDARSSSPAPSTDLYVIGDQTSEPWARTLIEEIAGPAGSSGGDADYLFYLNDSGGIPAVFQQLALRFLPEEPIFSGSLATALSELESDEGIPLDADRLTDERACFVPEMTQCVGFRWGIPASVGNEIQSDSLAFDLGFYTEQCRHNDGSGRTET
jgi:predicted ribosomally synthesized peptide with SipW-like signal peptide